MFASFNRPDWRGGAVNMGNHMRQLALLCACSLAACGDGDAARRSVDRDQKIFAAQDRVKAELRDPASAEFSDVDVKGVRTVCGRVNSRNGFGGMSGAQRFVVTRDKVFLEEQEESVVPGSFPGFWQQVCA
ncbi:hypothetical protein ACVWZA_003285 [Sphingomonas sp. UYAg733]